MNVPYKNEIRCEFSTAEESQERFKKLIMAMYSDGDHKELNFYTPILANLTGRDYPEVDNLEELVDKILEDLKYYNERYIVFGGFNGVPEAESTYIEVKFFNKH